MTHSQYNRLTGEQLRGRKAVTTRLVESQSQTIAGGTVVTIKRKCRGLEIQTAKCRHCGQQSTIRKVSPTAVDLLPV